MIKLFEIIYDIVYFYIELIVLMLLDMNVFTVIMLIGLFLYYKAE